MALVQVAIREHSDANFWDYFFKAIGRKSTVSRQQFLGQLFIKTLDHHKLIFKDEFDNMQYVQNILIHSFVTNNYLEDYFKFLYSFYTRNLFRDLPEDLTDDLDDLSDYIKSTLSGDDILRIEGSKNYPSSSYQLLKSTRYVIAHYLPSIKEMIYSHLNLLDKFYYDNIVPEEGDRFSIFFKTNASSLFGKFEKNRSLRTRGEALLNRNPYLFFNGKKVNLRIPKQKFRPKEVENDINLNIFMNNISVSYALETYKPMGITISEEYEVEIPSEMVFSKISVEIISKITKKSEIPEKYYRLFDDKFNAISTFRIGEVYLLNSKDHQFSCDEEFVVISEEISEYWNFHHLDIKKDTVCYIGQTPLSIDGEFAEKTIFEEVDFVVFDDFSKPIKTIHKHPKVFFRANKNTFKGAFLWYNDSKLSLAASPAVSWREFSTTVTYYGVTVDLEKILPEEDGEYIIILDEPGKNKKSLCHYLLLSKLSFSSLNGKPTLHEKILIKSVGDYLLQGMNCTLVSHDALISLPNFGFESLSIEGLNESYYDLNLISEGNCANFELRLNQTKYVVSVNVDVIRYRFSENSDKWFYQKLEYLWHSELTNELQIHIPNSKDPYIILDGGKKAIGTLEKDYFKFALHEFNYEIKKKERLYYSIILYYFDTVENKNVGLLLMKIFSKLDITRFIFGCDDNGVYIDTTFSGNADLKLIIHNSKTNETIENGIILKNGMNRLLSLNPTETYLLEKIMVESEDEFGFSENATSLGTDTKKPIDYEKECQKVSNYKKTTKPQI